MKQEDLLKALEAIGKNGIKVAGDLVWPTWWMLEY